MALTRFLEDLLQLEAGKVTELVLQILEVPAGAVVKMVVHLQWVYLVKVTMAEKVLLTESVHIPDKEVVVEEALGS